MNSPNIYAAINSIDQMLNCQPIAPTIQLTLTQDLSFLLKYTIPQLKQWAQQHELKVPSGINRIFKRSLS